CPIIHISRVAQYANVRAGRHSVAGSQELETQAVPVERPVIYLVDDDEIVLWAYHELLRGLGADIRTFVSAREFVESYRPAPVECLVCDLRMPGMCGLQMQGALAGMAFFRLPSLFPLTPRSLRWSRRSRRARSVSW